MRASSSPLSATGRKVLFALWAIVIVGWAYAGVAYWHKVSDADQRGTIDDHSLKELTSKVQANPRDVDGWILLGRSYSAVGQYDSAAAAFQHAYDLTQGQNVEAMMCLAEALVTRDGTDLNGRAGELFERSLLVVPDHPKALWYGGIAAVQRGDLQLGRDRLQRLLSHRPPAEISAMIEQKIAEINTRLERSGSVENASSSTTGRPNEVDNGRLDVEIRMSPNVQREQRTPLTLFIVALDPTQPGPPLAIQRRSSLEAPLTIQLGKQDAVIPTRSIAEASRVRVLAFLSNSSTPVPRVGDFYGEALYDASQRNTRLHLVIDRPWSSQR